MPIPKVIPTKIVAQFEEEHMRLTSPKKLKSEGVDKKYLSIKEEK